jgi:hypothetical protein
MTLRFFVVRNGLAVVLASSVAACGSTQTKSIPNTGTILPNATVHIGPTIAYSVEQIAVGAAAGALLYVIYDPLAPNWSIEEKPLNDDTYYLSLRAKSFRTGGDGEAIQIFKRRALQLQREKGYVGYHILDYSEGIESSTPLTHRVSEGTIQLVRVPTPPLR